MPSELDRPKDGGPQSPDYWEARAKALEEQVRKLEARIDELEYLMRRAEEHRKQTCHECVQYPPFTDF